MSNGWYEPTSLIFPISLIKMLSAALHGVNSWDL